ncbi:MAG: tetratricopeptide repeat protein [Planctomycetes bacterium]|nr:tetratricopeptide repeat protein [Planctomycetota bacterium]
MFQDFHLAAFPVFNSRTLRLIVLPLLIVSVGPFHSSAYSGPLGVVAESELSAESLDLPVKSPEVQTAIGLYQRGDRQRALEALQLACQQDKTLPPPPIMLARMLLFDGRLTEARPLLENSAREFPQFPGTFALLGNIALHEGRIAEAEALYEKVVRLAKEGSFAAEQKTQYASRGFAGLAAVAEIRRDWTSAKAALNSWLQIGPASAQARYRLGRALYHLGDRKNAILQLKQAHAADARQELPEVTLGDLARESQDRDSADSWYRQAVTEHDQDPRAHLALASWQFHEGELENAATNIETALKLAPALRQARYLSGLIVRQLRRLPQAEQIFSQLLQDFPADFPASNQLAITLADQKTPEKLQRALQWAEVNVRQYGQRAEALATLGWVQFQLGRLGDAEQTLQSAIQGGKALPDTAYYFARLHAARGRIDEAQNLLQDLLAAPREEFSHWADAQQWWTHAFAKTVSTPTK